MALEPNYVCMSDMKPESAKFAELNHSDHRRCFWKTMAEAAAQHVLMKKVVLLAMFHRRCCFVGVLFLNLISSGTLVLERSDCLLVGLVCRAWGMCALLLTPMQ